MFLPSIKLKQIVTINYTNLNLLKALIAKLAIFEHEISYKPHWLFTQSWAAEHDFPLKYSN